MIQGNNASVYRAVNVLRFQTSGVLASQIARQPLLASGFQPSLPANARKYFQTVSEIASPPPRINITCYVLRGRLANTIRELGNVTHP